MYVSSGASAYSSIGVPPRQGCHQRVRHVFAGDLIHRRLEPPVSLNSVDIVHSKADLSVTSALSQVRVQERRRRTEHTGGCPLPSSSFTPPVTVFDPLASLTASAVTTLLDPEDPDDPELELELDFFSVSSREPDVGLEEDEVGFEDDEPALAASLSLRARSFCFISSSLADADLDDDPSSVEDDGTEGLDPELELEPELEVELEEAEADGPPAAEGLLSSCPRI